MVKYMYIIHTQQYIHFNSLLICYMLYFIVIYSVKYSRWCTDYILLVYSFFLTVSPTNQDVSSFDFSSLSCILYIHVTQPSMVISPLLSLPLCAPPIPYYPLIILFRTCICCTIYQMMKGHLFRVIVTILAFPWKPCNWHYQYGMWTMVLSVLGVQRSVVYKYMYNDSVCQGKSVIE